MSLTKNKAILDQIQELFGGIPASLEDFVLASQISQAEAKKFFIEMTRLGKWHRTGIVWWNLIDGWPQFSDAVVDYYFGKKLAYPYIRRVQQPVCLMIGEPDNWHVQVTAGNDSRQDAAGSFRIWDADTGETVLEGPFAVRANENAVLGSIRVSRSEQRMLLMTWEIGGAAYGNHYLLGSPGFSLEKYKGWLARIALLPGSFEAAAVGR